VDATLTLVARRAVARSGTRQWRRGADTEGEWRLQDPAVHTGTWQSPYMLRTVLCVAGSRTLEPINALKQSCTRHHVNVMYEHCGLAAKLQLCPSLSRLTYSHIW
jgi:hypothetical protein